eukprot:39886_1
MSSNHPLRKRKRSRCDGAHDSATTASESLYVPPSKQIKLTHECYQDAYTSNKLKLLSKHLDTIYFNTLPHRPRDSSIKDYKRLVHYETNRFNPQISEIISALFSVNINPFNHESFMTPKQVSSAFKKSLREFYDMHGVEVAEKCYTQHNIYDVYDVWTQYSESCRAIANVICGAIHRLNGMPLGVPWRVELGRIYTEQLHTTMNRSYRTDIIETVQMIIVDGYLRHDANTIQINIPQCIAQVVSKYYYYLPISLTRKIARLFQMEMKQIILNVSDIEPNICTELDKLEKVFPMMQKSGRDSFYTVCWEDIEAILYEMDKFWIKQYSLGEIGIMEYTKKIETFIQNAHSNYALDKAGVDMLIPSYNQCILDKNNGYDALVTMLNKTELKRIYNVLRKSSFGEAVKLNCAYKNKNN